MLAYNNEQVLTALVMFRIPGCSCLVALGRAMYYICLGISKSGGPPILLQPSLFILFQQSVA